MNTTQATLKTNREASLHTLPELASFLSDLLETLQLQAAEIERLNAHVEQYTRPRLNRSAMGECVSRLSELHARLASVERPAEVVRGSANDELAGQRIPRRDMDAEC